MSTESQGVTSLQQPKLNNSWTSTAWINSSTIVLSKGHVASDTARKDAAQRWEHLLQYKGTSKASDVKIGPWRRA